MVSANEDDLKVLLSKRFVLGFENGIIVIKHWRINNYIQADRYQETVYLEEKNKLRIKENGAYTECIQNVSKVDTQVRLGKVSIDKINIKQKVKNNQIVPLRDGTKAKNYFGTWVDTKNNQIKIDLNHYPELKKYDVSTM